MAIFLISGTESKSKIKEYNLPVIPDKFYVELKEAMGAIREIVKELDKKPITISVLNTRVDTARDLVLKLYSKTEELLKIARFAEVALVYGNRYRSLSDDIDKGLEEAIRLFEKGIYKQSIDISIKTISKVDEDVMNRFKLYEEF